MSLYQLQREQVKDNILRISINIFREKGFDNATIDEITKLVGIAKGTFYNFFSTKKEILLAWAEKRFADIPFADACNPGKSTEENLYKFIDILIEAINEDTILFRSFLKEIIRDQGMKNHQGKFDFFKLYQMIFQSSADGEVITGTMPGVKFDVLNNSLFMGIMNWFESEKGLDGLESYLKKLVYVCMNGINNVKKEG